MEKTIRKNILIRCDDYPYGDPRHFDVLKKSAGLDPSEAANVLRTMCWETMRTFEKFGVNYVWGVSPCLFKPGDIEMLNDMVKKGRLVMHGFDHGVSLISKQMWSKIHMIYHLGGEYMIYDNADQINSDYIFSHNIMSKLNRYDKSLFIPPFNAYTQKFLDCMSNIGNVKQLLICDTEYKKFLNKLYHHDIKLSISEEGKSYTNIVNLLKDFDQIVSSNPDHICLHPIYDYMDFGQSAAQMYEEFSKKYQSYFRSKND